jgi:hypothetical protein
MRLVECSYEYCSDDGHHPRCKEYLRQSYRITYNERRALTLVICIILLGAVFIAGAMV